MGFSESWRFANQVRLTIEERVRNEPTRIDHLAVGVGPKRLARPVLDGVCLDSVAF